MAIQPNTNTSNIENNKQQHYQFEEVFSDKNVVKMTVMIFINYKLKKEDDKGSQTGIEKEYIDKRSKKLIKKYLRRGLTKKYTQAKEKNWKLKGNYQLIFRKITLN